MRIDLLSNLDRSGFYQALAQLLAWDLACEHVQWHVATSTTDPSQAVEASAPPTLSRLPRAFRDTMHLALLHREPRRHALLHRIAQRLWHTPQGWQDSLHEDHIQLLEWHRQVRRDMHKTKAFVRFNRIGEQAADPAEYVAWFEPLHHTLVEVAPFFVRRFTQMRWSILSPSVTLRWDGSRLHVGSGASRDEAPPADAGEALWLTYYAHIFNPARIKIAAMKKEMPQVYWKNLPEARLIPSLLAQAPARVSQMIAGAADTQRRLPTLQLESSDLEPADSLAGISVAIQNCDQCVCASRATQAVMGEGPATAKIFIVGEQPGDREDVTGRPFVGPSGHLLRTALHELGVDIRQVYVTNAVKHFSYQMRGKRRMHKTPTQSDVERCAQWLEAELRAVGPSTIVALGRTASNAIGQLAGFVPTVAQTHPLGLPPQPAAPLAAPGRWRGIQVFAVAHPAALLRAGAVPGSEGYLRWREYLRQVMGGTTAQTPSGVPGDERVT